MGTLTEYTSEGWVEIKTTNITVNSINKTPIMNVAAWIDANKKLGLYKNRKVCNCCKRKWKILIGDVWLVFTSKGNKTICDYCRTAIKQWSNV